MLVGMITRMTRRRYESRYLGALGIYAEEGRVSGALSSGLALLLVLVLLCSHRYACIGYTAV